MTRMVLSLCSAAFLASACAPLAQAPLVYSSKVSGGLSIVTTVADSPGVDVNIGYKAADTAYVPVAVSQPCAKTEGSSGCIGSNPITVISAGDNNSSDGDIREERLEAARRAASEALKPEARAQSEVDKARIALDSDPANQQVLALQARLDVVRTLPANPDGSPASIQGETEASLTVKRDAAQAAIANLRSTLAARQQELTAASDARKNADTLVAALEESLRRQGSSVRQDAYSVFGSFNNTTSGNGSTSSKPGEGSSSPSVTASMTLGKVFSTGMASQNVTDGLRRSATITATAQCLQAAQVLIQGSGVTDSAKVTMTQQAFAACSAGRSADADH